jgi:hypothetical protein
MPKAMTIMGFPIQVSLWLIGTLEFERNFLWHPMPKELMVRRYWRLFAISIPEGRAVEQGATNEKTKLQ